MVAQTERPFAMSVMGQERTYWRTRIMSVNGCKADEINGKSDIGARMSGFGGKPDVTAGLC